MEETQVPPALDVVTLLSQCVASGASDLHLSVDSPPMMRLRGSLTPITDQLISYDASREMIFGILTESQRARLEQEWELDFAIQIETIGRFRGNAHYSRGAVEAAFRYIPDKIPELASLGHRPSIFRICEAKRGLVLVTGITGSGKTTTMASMVQYISQRMNGVIVTVEDPIEFIYQPGRSLIKQREVGSDTHSFAEALRHAMRQDPDVILVGEMRDLETMSAAITAAETGHLVIATLHTIDAPKAVDRIISAFPSEQQAHVVAQFANCLEAIISQRLLPAEDGSGRVLATEVLVANSAVRATIRERRWEQLVGLLEIGGRDGMHTIDDMLAELYQSRRISKEEAIGNARDRALFESMMREPAGKKGFFR